MSNTLVRRSASISGGWQSSKTKAAPLRGRVDTAVGYALLDAVAPLRGARGL